MKRCRLAGLGWINRALSEPKRFFDLICSLKTVYANKLLVTKAYTRAYERWPPDFPYVQSNPRYAIGSLAINRKSSNLDLKEEPDGQPNHED